MRIARLALCAAAALTIFAPAAAHASQGAIDANVVSASGRLLGYLQGGLRASGHGFAVFRPATGTKDTGFVVALHAQRRVSPTAVRAISGSRLRMRLHITRNGTLSGRGRLGGAPVRLTGVADERVPRLRRGMKMLVVGHPSGEGYDALTHFFRPVRYDPRKHTRHSFLRERREFASYAALVFGDVEKHKIRTNPLLRAFYGAGKWVIVAPATPAGQDAIRSVHPYVPGSESPALAVRAAGLPGGLPSVRPTVSYPVAVLAGRKAHLARVAWFISELRGLGGAYMRGGRDLTGRFHATGNGGSFTLPYGVAAIEIMVPYRHEFTLTHTQNKAQYRQCGWNQSTFNAWCPDTWYWKQQSGGDVTAGCDWFLSHGYDTIDQKTVSGVTTTQNSDGAYPVRWDDFGYGFVQQPGDTCPTEGTQSGLLQGDDYYYALYTPGANGGSHTLVVVSDPTITQSTSGSIWHDNQPNGSGTPLTPGSLTEPPGSHHGDPTTLNETAWFLGRYTQSIDLTGVPALDPDAFAYSSDNSFPTNNISFGEQSGGTSVSQGYSVGVFGDMTTFAYSGTTTLTSSFSVSVPDWDVNPVPRGQAVTYDWTTNTPISWSTITSGGGGTWALNKLNTSAFSPSALSMWTGPPSCCQVNVNERRVLWFVDHYTVWNGTGLEDRFATTPLSFSDSPNELSPGSTNAAGPGIDLCDEAVVSPGFRSGCKQADPAPALTIQLSCRTAPSSSGAYTFSLNGQVLGQNDTDGVGPGIKPATQFTCPTGGTIGPLPLDPNTTTTLSQQIPSGLVENSTISCSQAGSPDEFVSDAVYKSSRPASVKINASQLPRGSTLNCVVVDMKPPS